MSRPSKRRCVLNHKKKINAKYGIKMILPPGCDLSHDRESFLTALSEFVPSENILAVMISEGTACVYLESADDTKILLKKGFQYRDQQLAVFPLLCSFSVSDIPPTTSNDFIKSTFENYGVVNSVQILHFCPDSRDFAHVLSSTRRLYFDLPKSKFHLDVPSSLKVGDEKWQVSSHCMLCESNGHCFNQCKLVLQKIKGDCPRDDSELHHDSSSLNSSDCSSIINDSDIFKHIPPIGNQLSMGSESD